MEEGRGQRDPGRLPRVDHLAHRDVRRGAEEHGGALAAPAALRPHEGEQVVERDPDRLVEAGTVADDHGGVAGDDERVRFLREVVAGIRETTGPDFQVGLRLTPERMGIELDDAVETACWALTSGLLDYLDMSLWDVRKEPVEAAHAGTRLIDHFTRLERGRTRLAVAGKILGTADAQWCLDQGADAAVIGTGAILQRDFATRALADADFRSIDQPVTRDHLAAEHLGPAFIDYLATGWDDFVKN